MCTTMRRYFVWGMVTLVAISLACSLTSLPTATPSPSIPVTSGDEQGQEGQPPLPTLEVPESFVPPEPEYGKIGDVIQSGDLTLFVAGWDNVPPAEYMKPDSGKKFIAVEVALVNGGPSSIQVGYTEFSLKDSTGQKYQKDFNAEMAGSFESIQMELMPGEKVLGKVGFQIPEDASGLQFIFEMGSYMELNIGKIFVDLGSQPNQVQLAGELPGEKEQTIHPANEAVQIGNLVITINAVGYPAAGQYTSPKPGNKFFVVDVTVENKGTDSVPLYSSSNIALKDSQDRLCLHDSMATMSAGGTEPNGDLMGGEKIRGQVGFQVPENATELVLIFDDDFSKEGKVFIALQ